MIEDFGEIAVPFGILYLMVLAAIWGASAMGIEGLSIIQRIVASVVLAPVVFFIVSAMNN